MQVLINGLVIGCVEFFFCFVVATELSDIVLSLACLKGFGLDIYDLHSLRFLLNLLLRADFLHV